MTSLNSWIVKYTLLLFLALFVAVLFGAAELRLWSQVTNAWYQYFVDFGWQEIDRPYGDSKLEFIHKPGFPYPPYSSEPPDNISLLGITIPVDIFERLVNGYPHLLRQWVTYPFFALALLLKIDPNILYSLSLPFVAAIVVWCIAKVAETLSRKPTSPLAICMLIPVSFLFFFMDGRIPYALTGFSLILYSQLAIPNKPLFRKLFIASVGIMFCSVTSGTMIMSFVAIVLLDCYHFISTKRLTELLTTLFCGLLFGLPLVWVINKTTRYFIKEKGSLWEILSHGMGQQILNYVFSPIGIALAVLAVVCAIVSIRILPRYFPLELLLVSICAVILGMLGNSVLVLVIVPITTALMTLVLKLESDAE